MRLNIEDGRADDVGRHKVGGELNTSELTSKRSSKSRGKERLTESWHAFDEDVSSGKERDERAFITVSDTKSYVGGYFGK